MEEEVCEWMRRCVCRGGGVCVEEMCVCRGGGGVCLLSSLGFVLFGC